jgi:hypothetical protein
VRFRVFLVLLAIAPAAWSQAAGQDERSALEVIDQCSESADEETIGLAAFEEECPGVTRALEQSGYLSLLSTASRDELDGYDLSRLLFVDSWYDDAAPADRDVDVATLGPILDSLRAQESERPPGWFQRFKRWLRSMLEPQGGGSSDNWLVRWLQEAKIPDLVWTGIVYVALAMLLGLTIFVIVNELRAAGFFRQRRKTQPDQFAGGVAGAAEDAAADFDALSADRKASMLLRMLVATLVRSGRLRTERSLTHRELCARARFDDARQRESFQRVAALAERTVYGSSEVPAEEVEPIVAAARDLDAQLRGAPA